MKCHKRQLLISDFAKVQTFDLSNEQTETKTFMIIYCKGLILNKISQHEMILKRYGIENY